MNSFAGIPLDTLLLHYVAEPALRSLALGGAVWLLLTAFRVRDVSFRLAAWTAVLYAALTMPLLGKLLPEIPVFLPAVHESAVAAQATPPAAAPELFLPLSAVTIPQPSRQALAHPRISRDLRGATNGRKEPLVSTVAVKRAGASRTKSAEAGPMASGVANVNPVNLAAYRMDAPARRSGVGIPWLLLCGLAYCAVAVFLLLRFVLGLLLSAKLRRQTRAIDAAELDGLLEGEMLKAGVPREPLLAESRALTVPATMGVLRPVILLPAECRQWNETQMRAVLAHELSHIARRDPLTQLLATLHRSLFWFSPLSWWLDRSIEELAEQASDDHAMRACADRTGYAEVLLNFLATLKAGQGRVRWQAVSMAQGARSRRRLERILAGGRLSRRLGQGAIVGIALAALPLVCLAATLAPTFEEPAQMPVPTPPPPPPPPANIVLPGGPPAPPALALPGPVAPKALTSRAPAVPPALAMALPAAPKLAGIAGGRVILPGAGEFFLLAPAAPDWPMPPAAPPAALLLEPLPPQKGSHTSEYWNYNDDSCGENQAFAVVSGDRSMSMCGSGDEMEHVRKLRDKIGGDFIWFRRDGRSYIIRDPAIVKSALDAFAPQKELGHAQATLGNQQAELGRQQAELGRRQSEVRVDVPDMSAQLAQLDKQMQSFDFSTAQQQLKRAQEQLAAAQKELDEHDEQDFALQMRKFREAIRELDTRATQEMLARAQAQAGAMQAQLGTLQALAAEKQAVLGNQQAELGRQQAELGRQQAELGRQQAEAARKAMARIRELIDRAMHNGLAKPE